MQEGAGVASVGGWGTEGMLGGGKGEGAGGDSICRRHPVTSHYSVNPAHRQTRSEKKKKKKDLKKKKKTSEATRCCDTTTGTLVEEGGRAGGEKNDKRDDGQTTLAADRQCKVLVRAVQQL